MKWSASEDANAVQIPLPTAYFFGILYQRSMKDAASEIYVVICIDLSIIYFICQHKNIDSGLHLFNHFILISFSPSSPLSHPNNHNVNSMGSNIVKDDHMYKFCNVLTSPWLCIPYHVSGGEERGEGWGMWLVSTTVWGTGTPSPVYIKFVPFYWQHSNIESRVTFAKPHCWYTSHKILSEFSSIWCTIHWSNPTFSPQLYTVVNEASPSPSIHLLMNKHATALIINIQALCFPCFTFYRVIPQHYWYCFH